MARPSMYLHTGQVETRLPDRVSLAVMGKEAKRQARSGITRTAVQTASSELPRDIHGINQARSRLFMADLSSNLPCDLHVWCRSPNGI